MRIELSRENLRSVQQRAPHPYVHTFDSVLDPTFVATPRDLPNSNEKGIPGRLPLGKLFALIKVAPERVLDFLDAHLTQNTHGTFGILHPRRPFFANGRQSGFRLYHARLVALARAVATKPTLGAVITLARGEEIVRRVVLGLCVNRRGNLPKGALLIDRQLGAAPHKEQKDPAKQVKARDGFVPPRKGGDAADDEGSDLIHIRQNNLLLWLSSLLPRLRLRSVHGGVGMCV